MLKTLKIYADKNGLTLNIIKTKVMIFNKNGRRIRKPFSCGNNKISTTRQYKYIGFLITPSGENNFWIKRSKGQSHEGFYQNQE